MTTILIVDDQPDNLYVLERLLKREGHDVVQAERGEQALELAASIQPDLLLLDVMMPDIDGFEVVRRLREGETTQSIPVILLTANAPDQRLKIQGLNLGADEYLTQPINNHELIARIKTLLRTKQIQNDLSNANIQLRTLLSVIQAGNSTLNLAEAGSRLIAAIVIATSVQAGTIWLVEQNEPRLLAASGLAEQNRERNLVAQAATMILPTILQSRMIQSVSVADILPVGARRHRYASLVVLPLIHRERVVGMVQLWSEQARTLTANESEFLQAIADATATSVQNARLFEETDRQRQRLEALDTDKDEFISIVAHELKNPLASIKGYAGLMARRARANSTNPSYTKGLDVIEQQVGRMTTLLDQLRDVSNIGINRFEIDPQVEEVAPFLERVVATLQSTSVEHPIEVNIPEQPLRASIDEFRLEQVLINLLSNAIKYSPSGGKVEVSLEHRDVLPPLALADDADGPWVVVTVRDHGLGIPKAAQERLFERFYRASNVKGRVSGMGLGLFISREIVQRHGGVLWAESEEGEGSLFSIALPMVADDAQNGQSPVVASVVEDATAASASKEL